MPSEIINYGTLLDYSPYGDSEESAKSRLFRGAIKAGRPTEIDLLIKNIKDSPELIEFFKDSTLVPIPKSSPHLPGSTFPSLEICKAIANNRFSLGINSCLRRITPIRKSSLQTSGNRPSVKEHYDTLSVDITIMPTKKIILVDDVLTRGSVSVACVHKMEESYPDADIYVFALLRTKSFVADIEKVINPSVNKINYYPVSGKTYRKDVT